LLPGTSADNLRAVMRRYLDQRIQFYQNRLPATARQVNATTLQLQNEMWAAVKSAALAQPTPLSALVVSGMNDVLNRQGYTQAAWWNRIPAAAWSLMFVIAICSNLMIGYSAGKNRARNHLLVVIPLVLAVSFLLLADLDSPRGGIIRVKPQNLISLQQSLQP